MSLERTLRSSGNTSLSPRSCSLYPGERSETGNSNAGPPVCQQQAQQFESSPSPSLTSSPTALPSPTEFQPTVSYSQFLTQVQLVSTCHPLLGALCPPVSVRLDPSHCSDLCSNIISSMKPSLLLLSRISLLLCPAQHRFTFHSLHCGLKSICLGSYLLTCLPVQNVISCQEEPLSVFLQAAFPVPRTVIGAQRGLHNHVFYKLMSECLHDFLLPKP